MLLAKRLKNVRNANPASTIVLIRTCRICAQELEMLLSYKNFWIAG